MDRTRTDGGFEIPFVASYETKPERTRFGLIMGFLANYASCRSIPESRQNRVETRWGVICNLFNYEGTTEKTKVRILWFIPIWFSR